MVDQVDVKNLVVYMPMSYPTLSTKTFRSFLEMTGPSVQDVLNSKNIKLEYLIHTKGPLDLNRNQAMDLAISNKHNADYMMFCDGDQVFKGDTILKLLATLEENPEADACTGIYFRKEPPHRCVVGKYMPWNENLELLRPAFKSQGFIAPDDQQTLHYMPLRYFDVIHQVHVFGMGCVLFKTACFDRLDRPYFKYVNGHSTGGDFTFNDHSEDMWFCSELYKKGVKVLCNPKVSVGHVVEKVIYGHEQDE
jgi:hypothetical protein